MTVADLETAVANVEAKVTQLGTVVTTALADFATEIAALQAAAGSGDTAGIQSSIDNLNTLTTTLGDDITQITGADPGPQGAAEGIVDAPTAGTGNEDPADPNSPSAAPTSSPSTPSSDTTPTDASSADDSGSTTDATTTDEPSSESTPPDETSSSTDTSTEPPTSDLT